MNDAAHRWTDLLPYESPLPSDPRRRRWTKRARVAAYAALAVILLAVVVQFQALTMRNLRRGEAHAARTGGEPETLTQLKTHKGAIGRWRRAVRQFWQGRNIYPLPEAQEYQAAEDRGDPPPIGMHPNMPFTVILLTPWAYMPVWAMALSWNLLKVAVVAGAILAAASVANRRGKRMPDWVLGLALLWSLLLVVGDFQHGNTNVFVLGAIALHLWLYRRGHDLWAGGALTLAICLKMTPALFLLYWLYQRNWKLLAGAVVFAAILGFVVPFAALTPAFGPGHYFELTGAWLDNMIVPGLVKGAWYPVHINQSISGVMSRYFLAGRDGNIFWNPDDHPAEDQQHFGYIHFAVLSGPAVRMIVRLCQLAVVGLMAWAIGWRKLPRDDARRGLHYALVLLGILLLNQRTWDHHAATLLLAGVAIWYAIGFGRVGRALRACALALMLAAGPLIWLPGKEGFVLLGRLLGLHKTKFGPHETFTTLGVQVTRGGGKAVRLSDVWQDIVEAYGPTFYYFLLMFIAAVLLSAALRRRDNPYADQRQKVFGQATRADPERPADCAKSLDVSPG